MCTEVKNSALVNLRSLVFGGVDLRVVLHEIADAFYEVAVLLLGLEELLLGEVGEADEQVHKDGHLQVGFFEHPQHGLHELSQNNFTTCACLGS